MKLYLYLLVPLLLIVLSCSNNESAGSTTVGNGLASSVVVFEEKGINTQVKLYSKDSNDTFEYTVQSNDSGEFQVQELPYGEYHLEVLDTTLQLGRWIEAISINQSNPLPDTISLDSLQTLTVFATDSLKDQATKFVLAAPHKNLRVDTLKNYENQLIGLLFYDLAPGEYSSLSLTNSASALNTWKDISLTASSTNHLYLENSLDVSPRVLWSFPLIVGVSDSMVKHFGDIGTLRALIENQLERAQSVFSAPSIQGKIHFSVDSLYVFDGELSLENTPPPLGFAYKLLYSPFEVSPVGNWNETHRVGVNDFPDTELTSTFSMESQKTLSWLLGLFRGAHYSSTEEVSASKNLISNTAYNTANIVMSLRSNDSLSDYTISILNRNTNSWIWSSDTLSQKLASQIKIHYLNSDNLDLANVQTEIFGVAPGSFEVTNSTLYSHSSDSKGTVELEDLHFLNPETQALQYSNFLIKSTYAGHVYFHWFPHSELGLYSLQNSQSNTYIKNITIDSP